MRSKPARPSFVRALLKDAPGWIGFGISMAVIWAVLDAEDRTFDHLVGNFLLAMAVAIALDAAGRAWRDLRNARDRRIIAQQEAEIRHGLTHKQDRQ